MHEYEQLLTEFSKIKDFNKQEKETYFDICGYPHYENVVSNVLAFFFDPAKPHGLKNICIEALLNISNPEIESIDEVWEVEREVRTDKGTFIDILLKNEEYVILIENKVYADLYNDLKGYLRYVKMQFPQQQIVPIVLCLHMPAVNNVSGFHVITYEKLFAKLRFYLANTIETADFRYMQMLTDLIVNMKKLKEGTKMNDDFLEFVSKHEEELVLLVENIKTYRDELRKKVKELNKKLPNEVNRVKLRKVEHRNLKKLYDIAVIEFILPEKDVKLTIDAFLDHRGWRFKIFTRVNHSDFDVIEYCSVRGIAGEAKGGRLHPTEKFEFNSKPEKVKEYVESLLELLTK